MPRLTRPHLTRGALALLGVVLTALAACREAPTAPRVEQPAARTGRMVVYADVGRAAAAINGIVIDVSGPGIVKADGATPDTLSFNLAVVGGVASGSIEIPAGENRTVTAHAFDGIVETHRGTRTGVSVAEGVNPTLSLTLLPLVGSQPITLTMGTTLVTVTPATFSLLVGDTTRMSAEVRDHNNTILVGAKVRWASLNPGKASVDTLGLVTVRDSGAVQIVATYGTVGGSAQGTGIVRVDSTTPPAYVLRWNGSVSRAWNVANNWTPVAPGVARVPTLTDSVIIPDVANDPQVDGAYAVRDLLVEAGATITNMCCGTPSLHVYGSADVRSPTGVTVSVQLRGVASRAQGSFNRLEVNNSETRLDAPTTVRENLYVYGAGNLRLNGHKLRVQNYVEVSGSGVVTMAGSDTLHVSGSISWNGGDENDKLAGGVLVWDGNVSSGYSFYGYRYRATGTNKLLLNATGRQQIGGFDFLSLPGNSSLSRLELANGGGLQMCGHVQVLDTLAITTPVAIDASCGGYYLRAYGDIRTVAGSAVSNYLAQLYHANGTSRVAGTWSPTYTELRAPGIALRPDLQYQNLDVYAPWTVPDTMALTGRLLANAGSGATGAITMNGMAVTVGANFQLDAGATLTMNDARDLLDVTGSINFNWDGSAAHAGLITAGTIRAGGDFYGFGFNAGGTHKVVFKSGARPGRTRQLSGMDFNSRAQEFRLLEIAAGDSINLCAHIRVRERLLVRAGSALYEGCGGYYVRSHGPIVVEAGGMVSPYDAQLFHATGTDSVAAGGWNAQYTEVHAADAQLRPDLGYRNLYFYAPARAKGDMNVSAALYGTGAGAQFTLAGNRVNVGGYFQVDAGAKLVMQNAGDTLDVARYVQFNWDGSATHVGLLTAGVLRVGEDFHGFGFGAGGTHKTVLRAASSAGYTPRIYSMNYESRANNRFQNLIFDIPGTFDLCSHVRVMDTLAIVSSTGQLTGLCGGFYYDVSGDLRTTPGSSITNYGVRLGNPQGTSNVQGTFSPTWTVVNSPLAAGSLRAGLGYQNMQFTTSVTLPENLTVNGQLYMTGPSSQLTLGGKKLEVMGQLNLDDNSKIIMTNPLDSLVAHGEVLWDQGGSHVGEQSAGTFVMRGPRFYIPSYYGSGTNTVVFDRNVGTGDDSYPRVEGVNSSTPQNMPLQNVIVRGNGIQLYPNMWVQGTLRVEKGRIEVRDFADGSLWVNDTLYVPDTTVVTNGNNFPTTERLSVVLYHPSGTSQIGVGTFDPYYTYFIPLDAHIKPTLAYRNVRVDRSTMLRGRTVLTGSLDVINDAVLNLAGRTLDIAGNVDLTNTARFRMNNALDSLIVRGDQFFYDPTGRDPSLLTAGTVVFGGSRFIGSGFEASTDVGLPLLHRFVFNGVTGAPTSVEGHPIFGQLIVDSPRGVHANSRMTVYDTLRLQAGTISGTDYVHTAEGRGGLVTAAGTDITVVNYYADDNTGTRDVLGRFRPSTRTHFRAKAPVAGALKPGLEYNSVQIGQVTTGVGTYSLTGYTRVNGDLDVDQAGTALDLGGQTMQVVGAFALNTAAQLHMDQPTDSLITGGTWRFGGAASTGSTFSDGTIVVSGNFLTFDRSETVDGTEIVFNGTGAGQQQLWADPSGFATSPLRDLKVLGTRGLQFVRGARINGSFIDSSTGPVTGTSYVEFHGPTRSMPGSSMTLADVGFFNPLGSGELLGAFTSTSTATYGMSGGTIVVRGGANPTSHSSITLATSGITVTGDSLGMGGNLIVNAGAAFTVPARSRIGGFAQTFGGLTFAGNARLASYLQTSGGTPGTITIDAPATVSTTNLFFISSPRTSCTNNGALRVVNATPSGGGTVPLCGPNAEQYSQPLPP